MRELVHFDDNLDLMRFYRDAKMPQLARAVGLFIKVLVVLGGRQQSPAGEAGCIGLP